MVMISIQKATNLETMQKEFKSFIDYVEYELLVIVNREIESEMGEKSLL